MLLNCNTKITINTFCIFKPQRQPIKYKKLVASCKLKQIMENVVYHSDAKKNQYVSK